MTPGSYPTVAVFASDKGPGDAERSSIMSAAGSYFARKGARIVTLSEQQALPVSLITSARTAGGEVIVIGDGETVLPGALRDVPLEHVLDRAARLNRIVDLADVLIGLPGSLASISGLYAAWVASRARGRAKPVILLNRHRAFEVLRGLAADVLSHDVPNYDRLMQFSDSVEDVWARVTRLVSAPQAR